MFCTGIAVGLFRSLVCVKGSVEFLERPPSHHDCALAKAAFVDNAETSGCQRPDTPSGCSRRRVFLISVDSLASLRVTLLLELLSDTSLTLALHETHALNAGTEAADAFSPILVHHRTRSFVNLLVNRPFLASLPSILHSWCGTSFCTSNPHHMTASTCCARASEMAVRFPFSMQDSSNGCDTFQYPGGFLLSSAGRNFRAN
mmetsp:Transcript_11411/g.34908  ORF Transcript_11411/g.34908 Transcript_11411/m.34908 type:complete len:202 (+) Transcript_11411:210-815(+)